MATGMTAVDHGRDMQWSTSVGPADRRIGDWIETISGAITEMDVAPEAPAGFAAAWRRYGLGPIDLNFLTARPQVVFHTPEMAARSRRAEYELLYMRSGCGEFRHGGEVMQVAQGGFVLLDDAQAFQLSFPTDSVCLTAHLHEAWLRKWVPHPGLLVAKPMAGADGWGGPLASLLSTIADQGLDDVPLPRAVIADQLGALLALMAGVDQPASLHQAGLLARLKRAMAERFDDPDLDPARLARDVGISKRHLHGVFAGSGTTFGAALLDIRLARARAMLGDPRYRAYRVGDIAWACGFADASHFARRFRAAAGRGPAAFRATLIDRPSPSLETR